MSQGRCSAKTKKNIADLNVTGFRLLPATIKALETIKQDKGWSHNTIANAAIRAFDALPAESQLQHVREFMALSRKK